MINLPRLGVRSRLLFAVVGAMALALAVGVTAFNILLGQRLSASATSLARARADAELSTLRVHNGSLAVTESPDEGTLGNQIWVFAGARVVESPKVGAEAVDKLPGFRDGLVSVQDAGAQYAAHFLDVQDGMRVLDACAAPGGKSTHLLESARIKLFALDKDSLRLEQVRENMQRLQLSATLLWRCGTAGRLVGRATISAYIGGCSLFGHGRSSSSPGY